MPGMKQFQIEGPLLAQSAACEPVLRACHEWFGVEEAVQHYLQEIEVLPTLIARSNGRVIGFLTLKQHFPASAEVLVMAIDPAFHRNGIGQAMMKEADTYLIQSGVQYLQVKTLAPTHPDEGYARTRAFYSAMGFCPLEVTPELWGIENPCLWMIKKLEAKIQE